MFRRWIPLALVAPLALVGCVQEPTVPKVGEQLITLSLSFNTLTFRVGRPDTITVTATSILATPATIGFNSDCQIVVTIRSQAGAAVVPPNGRPLCILRQTILTVPAEGSVVQKFVWNGSDQLTPPGGSSNMLPPGTYFVSAAINGINYSTLAAAVRVTLVAP